MNDETTTVTTVHERQVVNEEIATRPHDVPLDLIVTPEREIQGAGRETESDQRG
ncbi:MAG: hypothetical protein V5A55_10820 [Halovenus sp.]